MAGSCKAKQCARLDAFSIRSSTSRYHCYSHNLNTFPVIVLIVASSLLHWQNDFTENCASTAHAWAVPKRERFVGLVFLSTLALSFILEYRSLLIDFSPVVCLFALQFLFSRLRLSGLHWTPFCMQGQVDNWLLVVDTWLSIFIPLEGSDDAQCHVFFVYHPKDQWARGFLKLRVLVVNRYHGPG